MTMEELNSRIGLTICEIDDISIATNECTKLSIQFAINVLEEFIVPGGIYNTDLRWKIQELKQYLDE